MIGTIYKSLLALLGIAIGAGPLAAQPAVRPHYIGVGSCTGAACHGSPQESGRPAWQSAYTVWAARDPHSGAFATLFSDRSQQIVSILRGTETSPTEHRTVLRERCIGCHATPSDSPAALFDGVSCESCHGPASEWLAPHTRTAWTTLSASEKFSSHGMAHTPDLFERARLCSRCHVGPAYVDGRLHDVNHDLIAAGHPRLAFEFSAYLAHLPAHWDQSRDRTWADKIQQSRRDNFEVESWIAGQLATARAGLQLLQARVDPHATSVWPEFAEYDCAACHHTLAGLPRSDARQERPGRLVWGSWNYLPTIIGLQLQDELAPLEQLSAEMARLSPDRADVSRLAAEGLVRLDGLQKNIESQTPGAQRILARLRQDQNGNWDRANHLYLAAAALSGSYHDVEGSELREKLEAWRRYLEKPELEFDDSQFREALEELLKQAP